MSAITPGPSVGLDATSGPQASSSIQPNLTQDNPGPPTSTRKRPAPALQGPGGKRPDERPPAEYAEERSEVAKYVSADDPDDDLVREMCRIEDPIIVPDEEPRSRAGRVKGKTLFPHLLCVHVGTEVRKYINEMTFSELVGKLERKVAADMDHGTAPRVGCAFRRWADGRGLLGCEDKETADYLVASVAQMKVGEVIFKAWRRGEFGNLTRMNFYTPIVKCLSSGEVMNVLMLQNKLPGWYAVHSCQEVKIRDVQTNVLHHGWIYHVSVTADMKNKIHSQGNKLYLVLHRISVSFPPKRSPWKKS